MAYRKRISRRRFRPRRSNKRRFNGRIRRIARTTQECKNYTQTWSGSQIDNAWSTTNLAQSIVQGTDKDERIGNRIFVKAIRFKFFCRNAVTDTHNNIRMIFSRSKGMATGLISDDLPAYWHSPPPTVKQVRYYRDKTVYMHNYDNTTPGQVCVKGYFRVNKYTIYDGASGGDIRGGALMFSNISDSVAVSHPQIWGFIRVYYVDA